MRATHAKVKSAGGSIKRLRLCITRPASRRGTVTGGGIALACAFGRGGLAALKREGDGGTPIGRLTIVAGLYRPDRSAVRPSTRLPLRPIRPSDGWGDDPRDPNYNRPVRIPYPAGHEVLWREDGLYDVVLVLDWNLTRRLRHRGSAIFLHLARPDYAPTAGCVAVSERAMRRLLKRLAPDAVLVVGGRERPVRRREG